MNILISNSSDIPIYQQITDQMKQMILNGELVPGTMLPSIRLLARDLKISNITTKRAYEELLKLGFIESNSTKGYFVKNQKEELLQEEIYKSVEKSLNEVIHQAQIYHLSKEQIFLMLENLYVEEENGK